MFVVIIESIFSGLVFMTLTYDISLVTAVLIEKSKGKSEKVPVVYICFMTFCGIVNKISILFLFIGYIVFRVIGLIHRYDDFRAFLGPEFTLTASFGYLTPIDFNCLMTIQRLVIILFPTKNKFFSDKRLIIYCSIIMLVSFIILLIPYLSDCAISFHAYPIDFASSCGLGRHAVTLFQNRFTVLLPLLAMLINISLILHMRFCRNRKNTTGKSSARGKYMIRTTLLISIYLAIYELGKVFIQYFPELFLKLSDEIRLCFQLFRILSFCGLNFFVYFVRTKSTRKIVLGFYGYGEKKTSSLFVVPR